VPVAPADVPETGQHFDLVADDATRAAVRQAAGLRDLPRLQAQFLVTPHGTDGLHVAGQVSATVGQNCVVTLEPLDNEITEAIDLLFAPQHTVERKAASGDSSGEPLDRALSDKTRSGPEPLVGGVVDLGALATEFLILGLDPYPRKPDAVFEPPRDMKAQEGPFAVLARLTKGRNGG
jgi:hypothetical protein